MRWLMLAVVVGGCGSYWGTVPLGWRGSIPSCESPQVTSGSALSGDGTGFLSADREGRATLQCKGDKQTDVGVRAAAKLVIEGPKELTNGGHDGYWVHAYAADGEELRWADPSLDAVDWTTSWNEPDADVQRAYCHEPLFSCPDSDFARLTVRKVGVVTVRARFAGQTAELSVTVK